MQEKIISFNGVDGSGKTTQIELLQKKYGNCIGVIDSKAIFCNPIISDFNWWFVESAPKEFLEVIYSCLKNRNELIKQCEKPYVLLDKGIRNFDARAISTLMVKGLNELEAIKMVEDVKHNYDIINLEDLSLFFEIAKNSQERQKITEERKASTLEQEKFDIYSLYQNYQNYIIYNQIFNNDYQVFDASGTIESVNERLVNLIFEDNDKVKKYIL